MKTGLKKTYLCWENNIWSLYCWGWSCREIDNTGIRQWGFWRNVPMFPCSTEKMKYNVK